MWHKVVGILGAEGVISFRLQSKKAGFLPKLRQISTRQRDVAYEKDSICRVKVIESYRQ